MGFDLEPLKARLWDRAFAAEVDRVSSEELGIPSLVLMESAGKAVAEWARELLPTKGTVHILAGPGNNGGDGLVAARYLHDWGFAVHIYWVAKSFPPKFSSSCQQQKHILENMGLQAKVYSFGVLKAEINPSDLIVDAVIGLGFRGELGAGLVRDALEEASACQAKVLAVDLPSGLDANRGDQREAPLPAHATATFGELKPLHRMSPARSLCGEVRSFAIGFPLAASKRVAQQQPAKYCSIALDEVVKLDPFARLPRDAHKYDRGHVLVIGGSAGKAGAPHLAAKAALRAGAGWVSLALPKVCFEEQPQPMPLEATYESFFSTGEVAADPLKQFLTERKVRAVVVGPGCMKSPMTDPVRDALEAFSKSGGFLVFDAGACQDLLASKRAFEPTRTIATPHPGEWAKLGIALETPLAFDQVELTSKAASEHGVTLVYKHATPIIVGASAPAVVTDFGSNRLGKAGSGDVLAGIIAAHGALGESAEFAAVRSLALLARASEMAAVRFGDQAVSASDIVDAIGWIS